MRLSGGEPRGPVKIYGERSVETVTFLVKPEIGFYYDLNDKSRITLTGKYGLSLNDPSIKIDLDPIEYEGDDFRDIPINGNLASVLLGYRYTF